MRDWQLAGGTWKGNGEETKHHAQSHVNCTGTIHIVPWWRWGELTRDFGADHYAKTSPSLVHRFRYYGGALNHYTFTCLHSLLGPKQRCASLRKSQHLLKVDESTADARNEIYPWLHNPLACAGDITRCWSPRQHLVSRNCHLMSQANEKWLWDTLAPRTDLGYYWNDLTSVWPEDLWYLHEENIRVRCLVCQLKRTIIGESSTRSHAILQLISIYIKMWSIHSNGISSHCFQNATYVIALLQLGGKAICMLCVLPVS